MSDSTDYETWVNHFHAEVNNLYEQLDAFQSSHPQMEAAGEMLAMLNAVKADFAIVYGHAEKIVIDAMGVEEVVVLSDGTQVEKSNSSNRKGWQHKDLANVVSDRLISGAVDFETGEIGKSTRDLMLEMLDYAGVGYWKVTSLAELGVDADQYCTKGDSRPTISVRRPRS